MAKPTRCSRCEQPLPSLLEGSESNIRCPFCGARLSRATSGIKDQGDVADEQNTYAFAESEAGHKQTIPSQTQECADGDARAWENVQRCVRPAALGFYLQIGSLLCSGFGGILSAASANAARFAEAAGKALSTVDEIPACVGYFFCLSAPVKHGARTWAYLTFATAVLTQVVQLIAFAAPPYGILADFLTFVRLLFFLFFLRAAVVLTLKHKAPAQGIRHLAVLTGFAALIYFAGTVHTFRGNVRSVGPSGEACGCVPFGLVVVIWQLGILLQCNDALLRRVAQDRRRARDVELGNRW